MTVELRPERSGANGPVEISPNGIPDSLRQIAARAGVELLDGDTEEDVLQVVYEHIAALASQNRKLKGDFGEALRIFSQALGIEPTHEQLFQIRDDLYYALGITLVPKSDPADYPQPQPPTRKP